VVAGWIVLAAVLYGSGCGSCPCRRASLSLLSASGTVAFVGSYEGEHPLSLPQGDYRVLRFHVVEALRGAPGTTVEVRTGSPSGRCGITLDPGETVGVVAYAVPPGLVTGACTVVDPDRLRTVIHRSPVA
jgi:hypothetical protein